MMVREISTEAWGKKQEPRPAALPPATDEPIDRDRLIWDLEYRAEVSRRLKAAARSN